MVEPITSGVVPRSPTIEPRLHAANKPAAPSGFDEVAVRVELKAALRPLPAGERTPRQILAGLMQGFARTERTGQVIQHAFQAIRSKVQAFGLDLTAKRAQGLQQAAAYQTLLGGTSGSFADEAENLAKQAKRQAGKTQASMLRENRLADPARPDAGAGNRYARFRWLDGTIDKISLALKLTSIVHRFNAQNRAEDQEAAGSQNRVERSLRDMDKLRSDPERYLERPRLDLKI